MKAPVRVTVTGAAGQIGYALLFRIASGSMLGDDQPVILQLLDITPAMGALGGVKMELDDCAFPLLADVICTDDPEVAFMDSDYALLVGARPRGPGMERKDLLEANAAIFGVQGKAINAVASKDIKVLVVQEDQLVHKVLQVLKELQEMLPLVLKVHKDIKVIKVTQVIREHRVVYPPIQFLQVVSSYGMVQQMRFQVVGYYVTVIIVLQI